MRVVFPRLPALAGSLVAPSVGRGDTLVEHQTSDECRNIAITIYNSFCSHLNLVINVVSIAVISRVGYELLWGTSLLFSDSSNGLSLRLIKLFSLRLTEWLPRHFFIVATQIIWFSPIICVLIAQEHSGSVVIAREGGIDIKATANQLVKRVFKLILPERVVETLPLQRISTIAIHALPYGFLVAVSLKESLNSGNFEILIGMFFYFYESFITQCMNHLVNKIDNPRQINWGRYLMIFSFSFVQIYHRFFSEPARMEEMIRSRNPSCSWTEDPPVQLFIERLEAARATCPTTEMERAWVSFSKYSIALTTARIIRRFLPF